MHPFKKFGFGAIAAALFAVMAFATLMSTASATVTDPLTTDAEDIEAPGSSFDVTIALTGAPDPADDASDTHEVTVYLTGSPDATFAISGDRTVVCELTITDDADAADDDTIADGETFTVECDGDDLDDASFVHGGTGAFAFDLEVNIDDESDSGTLTITITADDEDAGIGDVEVTVAGDPVSGTADSFEIDAPVATEQGEEIEVTVTVLDEDGDPVEGTTVNVDAEGASTDDDDIDSDEDGESVFTFEVDDDSTGVVLTFYTNTGSIVNDDIVEIVTIIVSGDADSIAVTVGAVAVGGTSDVSATVLDEDGNPVPDADIDFIASAGSIVACDETTDDAGVAECTFVAPTSAQTVQITAVSAGAVGTATVNVGASEPGDGETGDGTLANETVFNAAGVGDNVFNGGTVEQLAAAVAADGGTLIWMSHPTTGAYLVYNVSATGAAASIVNGPFMAAFADGIDGPKAVFIVE